MKIWKFILPSVFWLASYIYFIYFKNHSGRVDRHSSIFTKMERTFLYFSHQAIGILRNAVTHLRNYSTILLLYSHLREGRETSFSSMYFHYLSEWLNLNWCSINICWTFEKSVIESSEIGFHKKSISARKWSIFVS